MRAFAAELYLGNPKNNLGVQFKYADRRNSPCVVIQGGDEKARSEVQIKDLILGAQIAGASGDDRDDYLQKQADAQFAAKESDLVDAVRQGSGAAQRAVGEKVRTTRHAVRHQGCPHCALRP